jgi:hypothetical protein
MYYDNVKLYHIALAFEDESVECSRLPNVSADTAAAIIIQQLILRYHGNMKDLTKRPHCKY